MFETRTASLEKAVAGRGGRKFAAVVGVTACVALAGCALAPKPLKPGTYKTASFSADGRPARTLELNQSENPAQATTHNSEHTSKTTLTLPAGTRVTEAKSSAVPATVSARSGNAAPKPGEGGPASTSGFSPQPAAAGEPSALERSFALAADATEVTEITDRENTVIGAAQADNARALAAKLSAMKPIQFCGVLLVLAALAMFHPAVRAVTMSTTLQAVTGAAGVALIFGPILLVGHEGVFLVAGVGVPALWFIVHRHGHLQGQVDAMAQTTTTGKSNAGGSTATDK